MSTTLHIPPVTLNDLESFRARIFHDVPEPDAATQVKVPERLHDDDDGLGYYPDGVKRTLTDEQVAIFRHSEIYALLRERQVKKENKDAGFLDEPAESDSKTVAVDAAKEVLEEGMSDISDSDDEAEYAAFLAAEQEQVRIEASRSKRKRSVDDTRDDRDRVRSTRRKTREMDNAAVDDTVLDYGEEPPNAPTSLKHPLEQGRLDGPYKPKSANYDDGVVAPEPPTKPAVEGRKIWWPTIGG